MKRRHGAPELVEQVWWNADRFAARGLREPAQDGDGPSEQECLAHNTASTIAQVLDYDRLTEHVADLRHGRVLVLPSLKPIEIEALAYMPAKLLHHLVKLGEAPDQGTVEKLHPWRHQDGAIIVDGDDRYVDRRPTAKVAEALAWSLGRRR